MKLGPYLKDKREKEGITLKEMEEKSGIRKDIIKKIEYGDFSRLPNERYAPLLIEKYAKVLNLDSEALFERFSDDFTYERETSGKKRKQSDNEDYQYLKKVFISFFAMILVLFVVWMILLQVGSEADTFERQPVYETADVEIEEDDGEEDTSSEEEEEETEESEQESEEDAEEEESQLDIEFVGVDDNTLFYNINTDEALTFTLNGNNSWASLTDNLGNTYLYEEVESGDFEIDSEASEVYLTVGSASGFDIQINGETLDDNQVDDTVTVYYQFNIEME